MLRSILTMGLAVAVAQGQIVGPTKHELVPLFGGTGYSEVYGGAGLQYDKLRIGTAEYGDVELFTSGPTVMIGSTDRKDQRLVTTRVEIEQTEGFEVSPIIYPSTEWWRFQFDQKPFKVWHVSSSALRFRFKVRSKADLPVGKYSLHAKVRFQTVNNAGISELRQLLVEMPIEVTDHAAKVTVEDRGVAGIRGITPKDWAEMILLAPVTIPLGIFMAIIGWDGC